MANPAFVVDGQHRLSAWNKTAENLFGYETRSVLGKRCDRLLCGTDVFGNRFCGANCPVLNMARHGERVHPFELNLRAADGRTIRVNVAIVVLSETSSKFAIMHVLTPLKETKAHSGHQGWNVSGQSITDGSSPIALTRREIEVLRHLAEGARVDEIAKRLFISAVTVRNHIQAILRKLHVHSRLEAVSLARHIALL
jgi:DNA-binding CsgD family transcriptional regulator